LELSLGVVLFLAVKIYVVAVEEFKKRAGHDESQFTKNN
jgi:hypothetical protein